MWDLLSASRQLRYRNRGTTGSHLGAFQRVRADKNEAAEIEPEFSREFLEVLRCGFLVKAGIGDVLPPQPHAGVVLEHALDRLFRLLAGKAQDHASLLLCNQELLEDPPRLVNFHFGGR